MREPREGVNLAERYDEDPMQWSRVEAALGTGSIPPRVPCFLATVRPNGRPHSAGVGVAQCDDDDLYFTSGPQTRKSRNLSAHRSAPCHCASGGSMWCSKAWPTE